MVYTVEPGSESERNLDLLRVIGLQPPSDAGSAADGSLSAEYSARTGASTR